MSKKIGSALLRWAEANTRFFAAIESLIERLFFWTPEDLEEDPDEFFCYLRDPEHPSWASWEDDRV